MDTILGWVLFEGGFYLFHHCDGRPGHITAHATTTHMLRIRMEVQNRHHVGGLRWHLPSIAAMIMKDDEVVAFPECELYFFLKHSG